MPLLSDIFFLLVANLLTLISVYEFLLSFYFLYSALKVLAHNISAEKPFLRRLRSKFFSSEQRVPAREFSA